MAAGKKLFTYFCRNGQNKVKIFSKKETKAVHKMASKA